jgi:hypothetical protein
MKRHAAVGSLRRGRYGVPRRSSTTAP